MSKILKYVIFLLPILFFWIGINFERAKYANDPEYIYLVNAVAICDGKSVGHIDNPGTTVMQIEALTIHVTHLLSNSNPKTLVTQVLKNPDKYIEITRIVILVMNSLVLLLLGLIAVKKTGSIWAALLLQTAVFITPNTLNHLWTKVSPEPVLFFVTCLYVITILWFYADKEKQKYKYIIYFALLTGAGLGTKATFLPLVIFPLIVLPTFKRKVLYVIGAVISFVLFTIPAIPEYENMYYWFRDLISHSGIYGQGEKELVNVNTYFPNILAIIKNNVIFAATIGLGMIVLIGFLIQNFRNKIGLKENWNFRILGGLVLSGLFGIMLVAKHYHANHYLIPVLLLTGITLFFVLRIIIKAFKIDFLNKIVFPVFVIALITILSWQLPPKMSYADYGYRITNEEIDSVNVMMEKQYSDYTKIYYYPYSLNKYSALNFGDVYTKRKMLPYLKKLYPETYFYNFDNNSFTYWDAEITLNEIVESNGDKILMVGGPLNVKLLEPLKERGTPLKEIYSGRIQAVYLLDTMSYYAMISNDKQMLAEKIICDAEEVSSNNEFFIGSNGAKFKHARARSDQFSRSGKYSFKLDKSTEFAAEYLIENLKVGDEYEVQVWRKKGDCSGNLVVAALNTQLFYKAENDYVFSDKGWDLIRIKFKITPEMQNQKMKVYLWNEKKQPCWFDDLTIKKNINESTSQ